jgi:spore coat polysaccharide biosynthesis protein SpsF
VTADSGRRLCIIQARTGSSRLPGKVLELLGGETVLGLLLTRLRTIRSAAPIVVATTEWPRDDEIEAIARRHGAESFRGSEDDVLDRLYRCATRWAAASVVRLTADNPCVDAELVDRCSAAFDGDGDPIDYLTTHGNASLPTGLSVEICSVAALTAAWREASDPYDREHVTPYVRNRPERFPARQYVEPGIPGDGRLTLDTLEDLEHLRRLDFRTGGRLGELGYRDLARLASSSLGDSATG